MRLDAKTLAQLKATNRITMREREDPRRSQSFDCAAPVPTGCSTPRFDAQRYPCEGELLRTSNPPQRYITFRLDHTRYESLVAVTDSPPRIVQLQMAK